MHDVIDRNWKGLTGLIRSRGITVVEQQGILVGPRSVRAGDDVYTGAALVLATGSRSRSIPGIVPDGDTILFSEHALARPSVPELAVRGGTS